VRTEVKEIPGRLEVDAYREEIAVEHEPVGQLVSEREKPWEEDGVLIIPIYLEQLVVTKRLVLRERMRACRHGMELTVHHQ
jgi:stress response protein YsnF